MVDSWYVLKKLIKTFCFTICEVHPVHGIFIWLLIGDVGEWHMPPITQSGVEGLIGICNILLTHHEACLSGSDVTILQGDLDEREASLKCPGVHDALKSAR